ncbi:PEP-CTERM sorting domain-containing protein [Massilia niastensis]|uniref:PEP-CTERM sorting domain-containing protein n=1 Tax=Massilia niastensis TaxID=544911 RepID=UPI00035D3B41|nr:PEP-CTERM sorting domain-containing protein [Massilia niastensis]
MPSRLPCVLASLLFSMSCGALAQVTVSAAYNNLKYELVDQDPNDGITPWATFELTEVSGTAIVFDSKSTILDECTITSMGSCTAGGPDGEGSVWFDGASSGARGEWSEDASGGVYLDTRAVFTYSISPRTDFTFILDLSLHKNPPEGTDAAGGFFFYFNSEEGWFRGHEEYRAGDRITPLLIETGNEPVRGEVRAYTNLLASHTVPPPVPEPSTWAMLSTGLLPFLGAAVRRRRHRMRKLARPSIQAIPSCS